MNGERKIARHVLAQLGFNELMHLDDYVLMGLNLKVDVEYAGIGG